MRALVWQGQEDVQVDTVPDPKIQSWGLHWDGRHDSLRYGHEQGLTMKMGQTHVQRYSQKLLGMIQEEGGAEPIAVTRPG